MLVIPPSINGEGCTFYASSTSRTDLHLSPPFLLAGGRYCKYVDRSGTSLIYYLAVFNSVIFVDPDATSSIACLQLHDSSLKKPALTYILPTSWLTLAIILFRIQFFFLHLIINRTIHIHRPESEPVPASDLSLLQRHGLLRRSAQ